MESVGIFYGHWEYFTVIWYISCSFDNVVKIWNIFHRFGILCQEKSGNPAHLRTLRRREKVLLQRKITTQLRQK
jgi:hypothetical protein